jgi:pyruvyltransferase|uniref:Polysaccharide pyruvyl transferase domain-containing protein n=1 Tax=viral metagenome TaxID=1070528 RepID=A0A6C0J4I2_9ZZZZ
MKQSVNVIYYNKEYNFGDQLSPFIVQSLLNKEDYDLTHNLKDQTNNIIAVGSYIEKAKKHTHIWGSGIIIKSSKIAKELSNVHAVRGPLTRNLLLSKNIEVPKIYGDPALLLPEFYKPNLKEELKEKIVVIPHKSNYSKYKDQTLDSKFYLVSPMDNWKHVIDCIASCKAVVSESLHGLICADAYKIPNLWLYEYGLTYGNFKFRDYFMSQKRPLTQIKTLNDFDIALCYNEGNKIDCNELKNAFPYKK